MGAKQVAKYFLFKAGQDEEGLITNLKLQKLLYYAQGYHLAFFDTPLFEDAIEKWTHGPVVPLVYQVYKGSGNGPIDCPIDFKNKEFSDDSIELLEEIYQVYGQFSASALRNISHIEPPWINAEDAGIISQDSLKDFFKTRIK